MMGVHHASDSVKPKTVKHVLLHVKAEVGEEEAQDLVVAVVEEATADDGSRVDSCSNQSERERLTSPKARVVP